MRSQIVFSRLLNELSNTVLTKEPWYKFDINMYNSSPFVNNQSVSIWERGKRLAVETSTKKQNKRMEKQGEQ